MKPKMLKPCRRGRTARESTCADTPGVSTWKLRFGFGKIMAPGHRTRNKAWHNCAGSTGL
jgi:hypothetical protein